MAFTRYIVIVRRRRTAPHTVHYIICVLFSYHVESLVKLFFFLQDHRVNTTECASTRPDRSPATALKGSRGLGARPTWTSATHIRAKTKDPALTIPERSDACACQVKIWKNKIDSRVEVFWPWRYCRSLVQHALTRTSMTVVFFPPFYSYLVAMSPSFATYTSAGHKVSQILLYASNDNRGILDEYELIKNKKIKPVDVNVLFLYTSIIHR